jgi:hypothetical protein
MLKVRRLEKDDIISVLKMAKDFQENSLFKGCGFDENKVLALLDKCLDPKSPYFLVVGEVDKKIKGAFCGHISEYFFSKNRIASDLAIYVNPEDRRFALKFLNKAIAEFEKWAKKWKAMEVCISGSSGSYSGTYEKFLKRKHYNNIGFITKKGV